MPLDARGLSQEALIELYDLDLNPLGVNQVLRFCNWSQVDGASVTYNGQTYAPYPIRAEGFETSAGGQLPTPSLTISNALGEISALNREYQDLLGARLTRTRIYASSLGTSNAPSLRADIYYVERKAEENDLSISYELSTLLDLSGFELPSRPMLANLCGWEYRSSECSYAGGAVADRDDNPTNDLSKDRCGLRLKSCKMRFGSGADLPYGGFPGLGTVER